MKRLLLFFTIFLSIWTTCWAEYGYSDYRYAETFSGIRYGFNSYSSSTIYSASVIFTTSSTPTSTSHSSYSGDITIPSQIGWTSGSSTYRLNVKSVDHYAFAYCTGLTSVTIPSPVFHIGYYAFYGCDNLRSVTIPESVTNIENYAFYGCDNAVIHIQATTPPSISSNSFSYNSVICVPAESYSKYANATYWKDLCIVPGAIALGTDKGSGGFGGSGSGTENDPYLIFNPVQLYNVRNFTGDSNVYFKLMADIDLTEFIADNSPTEGWEPIGPSESPFMGTFLGNNHTISGISINRNSDCAGFFGCLLGAKISDLTITGTNVNGNSHVGAVAGVSMQSTLNGVSARFNNVSGNEFTGGLVGVSQGFDQITSCNYNGNVTSTGDYTGGLIGSCGALNISSSSVTSSSISGSQYTGGAIGYAVVITATNCYAFVDNVNGTEYTGGFAGRLHSTNDNVNSCGVVANVHGKTPMGGFTGISFGTLSNLFAVGDITSENGAQYIGTGGIAGELIGADASLTNSYFSGNIHANNNYVGGLVGSASASTISKNYSKAAIDGLKYVGGIVGDARTTASLSSNVAAGEVVNAVNGEVGRIFGTKASTVTIGANGTKEANRGLTTMRIVSQGLQVTPTDGEQHGTNLGKSLLKYKTTYQGLNWDFTSDWTILDTESFPYKPEQCAPPTINGNLSSGMTTISGNSIDGGTVYVTVNGKKYSATTSNNQWNVTVDPLPSGETVKVFATVDGKVQSYIVTSQVGYAGSGIEEDPYLIYTASDLANINSYSYYKVMNDIDLTDYIAAHDNAQGWEPIGFTGGGTMKQLDGNGKTISGLWFNRTNQNCGLISNIENATVKNLKVKVATGKKCIGDINTGIVVGKATGSTFTDINVEGSVNGGDNVGALVGSATSCVINNVYADGVTVEGQEYTGAVIGLAYSSEATNTIAIGTTVTGTNYVGGIAGHLDGNATRCSAQAVLSGSNYLGGIAGKSTGNIILSVANGTIATNDTINCIAGGIAGHITGDIANCYSAASVKGGVYAGGIAGYTFGKIDNSYSCGDIAATNFGAGVAGYLDGANAAVNHCFAINNRIDVSDQKGVAMRVIGGFKNGAPTPEATNYANKAMVVSVNDVTQTIYDDLLEGKGVQLATLKQQATYTAQGWDFNETWGIKEGESYPYLQWTAAEPEPQYTPGDVNNDGFVRINDVVATVNYIVNGISDNFNVAAADVNQDSQVKINDVVLIVGIIVNGPSAAPAKVAPAPIAGNDYMTAQGVEINAGETRYIDIALNNDNAFSALQMDINLPDGLVLKGAELTSRAGLSHSVAVGNTVNGKATLAAFSMTGDTFEGNNGALLRLEVMATGNVTGDITFDNIYASTARGVLKQLDAVSVGVNTVTGINDITVGNGLVNVYNTAGQLVRRNVNSDNAATGLPAGLYLIGGKKVVVK
ncbi:MAG: leucine-rich repeat protein [Bacteroidales bacterium]|nr:leucine-rich repeat protein [Candidatus Sodaliphilus limicaballi]